MTHNRIIIPTEREKKSLLFFAWQGNKLDPVIEEAEKRNSFFVSGYQFTDRTLRMLGIKPTLTNRANINAAFSKAHDLIVIEICEMENREVSK